jgi:NAD(P)-dependent dehydrogenase (short-subunit alcohol dehydrogenase family)
MKNILIIGGTKGIGWATVNALHPETNLFVVARNPSDNMQSLGIPMFTLDAAHDELHPLDALPDTLHGVVYCPGSIVLKPFQRLTPDTFLADYQQNVLGAVRVLQKVFPALQRADSASVVLFSSVAAKTGMPFHASIAAAKAGVEGLTLSLAAEWATHKIRVNAIAPSLTDTSLSTQLLNTDEKRESAARRHPLQQVGDAHEMAAAVKFLLSDQATWITGQVIGIDGGMGTLKT